MSWRLYEDVSDDPNIDLFEGDICNYRISYPYRCKIKPKSRYVKFLTKIFDDNGDDDNDDEYSQAKQIAELINEYGSHLIKLFPISTYFKFYGDSTHNMTIGWLIERYEECKKDDNYYDIQLRIMDNRGNYYIPGDTLFSSRIDDLGMTYIDVNNDEAIDAEDFIDELKRFVDLKISFIKYKGGYISGTKTSGITFQDEWGDCNGMKIINLTYSKGLISLIGTHCESI
jgi:hypothetical protein